VREEGFWGEGLNVDVDFGHPEKGGSDTQQKTTINITTRIYNL
jgi:hypothetical protein